MVRMSAHCLSIGLAHVLPFLGLAVVLRPRAVVHLGRSIDPDHPWPAACSLRHCSRSLGSSASRRTRSSLGCHRCSSRCRHCRCALRRSRSRNSRSCRCGSWSGSRIPLLHPLMSTAGASLARSRRIRPVLARPSSARRLRTRRSCHRSSLRGHSRRSCRSSRLRRCRYSARSSSHIPVLHSLVSTTSTLLARRRRVCPVFT